ncbi:ABC transporter substrate-binding protein [Microvirga sp. BT689]|uniref:ABC transporter substrate-binding protein n=1 Tax=Microvirga arvi TaxID=2778731 RepID=UPI00195258B6|nr:ABC transporter substrate-binding protein [Microvirga arvi]MBM6583533.1 ABC transporter substrate-binding protein [Microvirga arvi]
MNIKEKCRVGVSGLAVMLIMSVVSQAASTEKLTVVNQGGAPGDAQRKAVFEPFTAKTGIGIVADTYNQELAKIRAQIETGNLIWDAASVHSLNESIGCDEGLLEPIDWSKLLPEADFKAVGGFGKCGAPYLVSPGGLVYDAERFSGNEAPKSWKDFWNIEKWPGKRGLPYQPDQVLEIALISDGVAPKDVPEVLAKPGGVDRAFAQLEKIKPHIVWWKTGDESMQLLLTKEIAMGYGWQGRVNVANRSNKRNLRIVWEAGYTSAVIYMAVMKGSPRKQEAIELIKYTLAAEPQAHYAELMGYPPANERSFALLSEENRASQPTKFLDRGMMQAGDLYIDFWRDNGDSIRQRFSTFAAR